MKKLLFSFLCITWFAHTFAQTAPRAVWSKEKANEWYSTKGWLRGADFIPSTAINQLEMWQANTFDPATIDRELGYAQSIGLNCMRVFLHHVAWQEDKQGFKNRMNQYLAIADKHGISTMFVFLMTAGTKPTTPAHSLRPKRAFTIRAGYATRESCIMMNPDW